jgi:hypothetical protein
MSTGNVPGPGGRPAGRQTDRPVRNAVSLPDTCAPSEEPVDLHGPFQGYRHVPSLQLEVELRRGVGLTW